MQRKLHSYLSSCFFDIVFFIDYFCMPSPIYFTFCYFVFLRFILLLMFHFFTQLLSLIIHLFHFYASGIIYFIALLHYILYCYFYVLILFLLFRARYVRYTLTRFKGSLFCIFLHTVGHQKIQCSSICYV